MPRPRKRKPSYCIDKATHRAYVRLPTGKVYLGTPNSPESLDEYDRVTNEWIGKGRPTCRDDAVVVTGDESQVTRITVAVVLERFWNYAVTRYPSDPVKPGQRPTGELGNYWDVLRILKRLYQNLPAEEFKPLKLKALRQTLVDVGHCRNYVNRQVKRVQFIWRWALTEELVPSELLVALDAVDGLRKRELGVKESKKVKPPAPHIVAAVRACLPQVIRDMVDLQGLSGMRSSEMCTMRTIDIDRSQVPWVYEPTSHKTEHHDIERRIKLGPKSREIVERYLNDENPSEYLFRPKVRDGWGDRYNRTSYLNAVVRAGARAFPPPADLDRIRLKDSRKSRFETEVEWRQRLGPEKWKALLEWDRAHRFHPHQLRHQRGKQVRRDFGVDGVKAVLGHSTVKMAEHYSELDDRLSDEVAERGG